MIEQHEKANESFNSHMEVIIKDEEERIEEERLLDEEIAMNHGKLPGYF